MTNYKQKAKEARLKVLEMIHKSNASHVASNFSILDVATVLYENLREGDDVVWSKGWAAASIYYFLAKQGTIPKEDLDLFAKEIDGKVKYLGLAETNVPGVLVNGGSMGHGLPIACGMAKAKKLKGDSAKVYCIMSDGEMNEGTTWESAMFAAHNKLDNLVVIVDKNKWQAMGKTEEVLDVDLVKAWKGFNWHTHKIDGHNYDEIEKTLLHICEKEICLTQPMVMICDTIKGKGVSFFEDHLLYHYKFVDEEEYKRAQKELLKN